MKIIFISVVLNIHQACIADEFYRICNGEFHFIQTGTNANGNLKGGSQDFSTRPYLIDASKENPSNIQSLIDDADVVIHGASPLSYIKNRIRNNKLTFIYGERWLKRGLINIFSPRLLKHQWFYHTHCHGKQVYALCSSAYASKDYRLMHSFRDKCYKWGYFTSVPEINIDEILSGKEGRPKIKILWIARFLKLKHPERMIELGKALIEKGYDIEIDMIGEGEPLKSYIQKMISDAKLNNVITLHEPIPNEELLIKMRGYHIFCFTSDKREGWGAVLGEAMAAGCCPVASIECGSAPYLIENGENGFTFNLFQNGEFEEIVQWLIDNPSERKRLSYNAYKTMRNIWNPASAVKNFYSLASSIVEGKKLVFETGPCSKA